MPEYSVIETLQNAAVATGAGTAANMKGHAAAILDIAISNTATVTFEGTIDDTNWWTIALRATTQVNSTTYVTTATASGAFLIPIEYSLSQIRANVSAYTSGTVTAKIRKRF